MSGEVFPCPVHWTIYEAREEIRALFMLQGGGIRHQDIPVLGTDLIGSFTGNLVFVGGQPVHKPLGKLSSILCFLSFSALSLL